MARCILVKTRIYILFKSWLGYLKDSNAAAHSVDVLMQWFIYNFIHDDASMGSLVTRDRDNKKQVVIWTMFGHKAIHINLPFTCTRSPRSRDVEIVGAEIHIYHLLTSSVRSLQGNLRPQPWCIDRAMSFFKTETIFVFITPRSWANLALKKIFIMPSHYKKIMPAQLPIRARVLL